MSFLQRDAALAQGSYYAATAPARAPCPPLQGAARADVAVVGGGLAGLSAALELAERGRRVVLLEAHTLGHAASGRNGGQALHGLACDLEVVQQQLGDEAARTVWAMTIEALALLRSRIQRHGIDCDWQAGYLNLATSPRKAQTLWAWADALQQLTGDALPRIAAAEVPRWIASPRFHGGVHDPRSGHLHPLKYLRGLAQAAQAAGVQIHEHTPAQRWAAQGGGRVRVETAQGHVDAGQLLLAGNAHLHAIAPAMAPALARRVMPVGTYVACTQPLPAALADALIPSRSAVCDSNFVVDYFRLTPDHRLLFGAGVSYSTRTPPGLRAALLQRMRRTFPQLPADTKVEHLWGGFVDITMNRAPDFGRLAPNVLHLQGFSGHGLALTGLAGQLAAQALCGEAEGRARFDLLAQLRHRPFPGGPWGRTPALVLAMAWYRARDMLG